MTEDFKLVDIEPEQSDVVPTAAQVSIGIPIPPVRLLAVLSADDWEAFTEEWLTYHKSTGSYHSIKRLSGPGDLGLDVVAFTAKEGFAEPWDSFQCKHYDHALYPTDIYGEVAKIIYHSFRRTPPFNQHCRVPRRHVFVTPQGLGTTLSLWLKDPERFKDEIRSVWDKQCAPKLGMSISAPLEGELSDYVDEFDFSIFDDKTGPDLIAEHSRTVFHTPRFGGGLPPRDEAPAPPAEPGEHESLYLRKLLDVYEEELSKPLPTIGHLDEHPNLLSNCNRQRVRFYSAEALRNFARDRTPSGTFESLQDDIFNGVIDVCEAPYESGFDRLRSTITAAAQVDVGGNALVSVTRVRDKQGACHQLANEDLLTWVLEDD